MDAQTFFYVALPSHDVRGMFCGCLWVAKGFYSLLRSNYTSQIVGQTWLECERESIRGVRGQLSGLSNPVTVLDLERRTRTL